MNEAKTKTIAFRTSNEEYKKIKTISDKYSVPDSQIIRWALEAIISYEQVLNSINLPLNFGEIDKKIADFSDWMGDDSINLDKIINLAKMQALQTDSVSLIGGDEDFMIKFNNPYSDEIQYLRQEVIKKLDEADHIILLRGFYIPEDLIPYLKAYADGDKKALTDDYILRFTNDDLTSYSNIMNTAKKLYLLQEERYNRLSKAVDKLPPYDVYKKSLKKVQLPFVGKVACGQPVVSKSCNQTLQAYGNWNENHYIGEANGESMLPTVKNGERFIFETENKTSPKHYELCVIQDAKGLSLMRYNYNVKGYESDNSSDFVPVGDVKLVGYYVEQL